jgi:hypothetical protein
LHVGTNLAPDKQLESLRLPKKHWQANVLSTTPPAPLSDSRNQVRLVDFLTNEAARSQTHHMKLFRLPLLLVGSLLLAACSNFLDLGSDDKEPAPGGGGTPVEKPGAAAPGDGKPAAKPKVACGTIAPGVTELFRASGNEIFNIMWMASDGAHLYLAGSAPLDSPTGPITTPDPANKMKTASVLRVPASGGAREVIDFEHGRVSRGVTFDADNIY